MRDRNTIFLGTILFVLPWVLMAFLYLKPYEEATMSMWSLFASTIAFLISYLFVILLLRLYGVKSSEGQFWLYILVMLTFLLIGVIAPNISPSLQFGYFAAIAFIIITYAIVAKLKAAGMQIDSQAIFLATVIVIGVIMFVYVLSSSLITNLKTPFDAPTEYYIDFSVAILSLVSCFASILLAKSMGGFVSKGWYFIALGGGTFALSYLLITIAKLNGLYYDGFYLDALNIIALNYVTFSAYYQRKMHMELISGFI